MDLLFNFKIDARMFGVFGVNIAWWQKELLFITKRSEEREKESWGEREKREFFGSHS